MHIDAQSQRTVIDAREFVVTEKSPSHGIYQFLVVDSHKLPFADGLERLYLRFADRSVVLVSNAYLRGTENPYNQHDDDGNHHRGCDDERGDVVGLFQ